MAHQETLKQHAFLAGMADCHVAKLALLAEEVDFDEREVILVAGEQSKKLYFLLSGSVCVEVKARCFTVCIQVLSAGDAFGWSSLLDHHDTLFQVRARERSAALCLDGPRLSALCREDPELGEQLLRRTLKLVAGRVQATEAKLGEFCGLRSHPAT